MQHIQRYIDMIEHEEVRACEDQKLLVQMVKRCFESEPLFVDERKVDNNLGLIRYYPYDLLSWERFVYVLHNCTYKEDKTPRFPKAFIYVGRGSGKNGYTSFEDMCCLSPYNTDGYGQPIRNYHIQSFAAAEDNAKTSFMEIHDDVLERNKNKMSKFYKWTLESIQCTKTGSTMTYHTSRPDSKDGGRPGKINLDEVHVYENYDLINVATGGLGKKTDPRILITSTDGYVRDGPMDDYKAMGRAILRGERADNGFLPFMCSLKREEISDPDNWVMAVPSLTDEFANHKILRDVMLGEYAEYERDPVRHSAFAVKRCNCPTIEIENALTSWDNIQACCEGAYPETLEILNNKVCVCGLDYSKTNDFMAAVLLFRVSGKYYCISHTWICKQSADLYRIRFPYDEAIQRGEATMVDDVEIPAELPVLWLKEMRGKYRILAGAADSFRFSYLKRAFRDIFGFEGEIRKKTNNYGMSSGYVYMNRPSDLYKAAPEISTSLEKQNLYCGDSRIMRWYMGNVKKVLDGKGNTNYEKIEPKSRKTDGFMALAAAFTLHEMLERFDKTGGTAMPMFRVRTYD